MKYLKRIGYLLIAFLILFIVLGIFMPKNIDINVAREIDTPVPVVFNIVNDLSTQETWNPWLMTDEAMEMTFSDQKTGPGASYSWISEKSGTGSQTITNTIANQRIDMDVVFDDNEASNTPFTFENTEDGVKVTWAFQGKFSFPTNIMGPFFKRAIRSSYKKGLKSLESLANERWKDGKYLGYEIKMTDLPERNFIVRRDVVRFSEMQQFYATNLGSLFQAVQKAGEEMDGMPSGLFYSSDLEKGTTDMAAAIPVKDAVTIANTGSVFIPEGNGLEIEHYGDYSLLSLAHQAAEAYMKDRGLIHNAPFIEEYMTDPGEEKDSQKWLTKVYYYLADTGK